MTDLRLSAIPLPGLSPDSLGNYLASLGLLRVLSRKWPSTRVAWRDEVLQVVGGPSTLGELLDELVRVAGTQAEMDARKREWTQYDKAWSGEQKKGTKAKSGAPLALWQAQAEEAYLELFAAHAVPHARVSFNPLLGSGGNAGRRDFSTGWKQAVDALAVAPKAGKGRGKTKAARSGEPVSAPDVRRSELSAFLLGQPLTWLLEKLAAGSWFSEATKLYNSGQSPAREGQISPWAMVLACEGLALLVGGASRRLGARTRAVGAFPFVTQPVAPEAAGEAGRILGEIWTPLWSRPMTLAEAQTLFSRGRAELRGRGAVTPAAFATAIRKRGVDAGISEFRRFTLGRTTSANTFEPRLEARFSLDTSADAMNAAASRVLECVTALIEQRGFPRDRKVGQRWRFEGLRGPIEAALLDVAADPNRSESSIALLDTIVAALDRIDRNRSFREGKVRWEPLPLEWLPSLFADEQPEAEARLALSLASAFPAALPFAAFRFGVEWAREKNGKYEYDWGTKPAWFEHTKVPPARWVWGPGELARVLSYVLSRKLLEEARLDGGHAKRSPGRSPLPATAAQVQQWLAGELDEQVLAAWLSRLALFDWRWIPEEVRSLVRAETFQPRTDGALALLGLVQPFVDQRPLVVKDLSPDDLLSDETGARTAEVARSLTTLIRAGSLDAAIRLAGSRYSMAHARLASFDVPWRIDDPDHFVAALLFAIPDRDRAIHFQRWLRPRRQKSTGETHV
ncbi:MAG: type I-U CRISPR-associated protein Csx17 [Steroidobacteraceae bacterium]|jgi:CRISPR-associated protein Csx17|nr:type I-U CRISPR-associated protein Csx17 [Steroidobacteraceae bacterium]